MRQAAWNGDHAGLGFTQIDTIFTKVSAKTIFTFMPLVTLTFSPQNSLPVTRDLDNLSSHVQHCRFSVFE